MRFPSIFLLQLSGLTLAASLDKQQANNFLGGHKRVTRKAKQKSQSWEYEESPWEEALEWVDENKESRNLDEEDVENFKDCTEEYTESYEHYDEAMEKSFSLNRPRYDCSIGGRLFLEKVPDSYKDWNEKKQNYKYQEGTADTSWNWQDGPRDKYSGPSWMGDLPDNIKNRPITTIAIPGSHDSFAHDLDTSSALAQNSADIVKKIEKYSKYFKYTKYFRPFDKGFKTIVKNWGVTQDYDIARQLNIGIRYLDLRVMRKIDSPHKPLYTAHSLYAERLDVILKKVKSFLNKDESKKEVVILHFQHLIDMSYNDYNELIAMIDRIIGREIIYENGGDFPSNLKLKDLQNSGKKVIIIYGKELGLWR